MKLGCRCKSHQEREAIRHYANQPACPLWPLHLRPNFTSTNFGVTPEKCLKTGSAIRRFQPEVTVVVKTNGSFAALVVTPSPPQTWHIALLSFLALLLGLISQQRRYQENATSWIMLLVGFDTLCEMGCCHWFYWNIIRFNISLKGLQAYLFTRLLEKSSIIYFVCLDDLEPRAERCPDGGSISGSCLGLDRLQLPPSVPPLIAMNAMRSVLNICHTID